MTLHKGEKVVLLLKEYMTIFFICSIKSPQCTDKSCQNKNFDTDFPSSCFDVPKTCNITSGKVQNRETKNRRLGMIVTSFQDSKLREKQISQAFFLFRADQFAKKLHNSALFIRK